MPAVRGFLWPLLSLCLVSGLFAENGQPAAPRPAKSKRRPPPTVQEIEKAFRIKSDQPRVAVFNKLQRAGVDADQPEIVAALTAGLTDHLEKKSFDVVDLRLEGLLAEFPSNAATAALASFLSAGDPRVVLVALRSLTESGRSAPWEQVLPVTKRDDYSQAFALRRAVVQIAELNGSKEAVDFLVQTVSSADGQLKYEAARALTALTGQKFGGQHEKWVKWWSTAREDSSLAFGRDRMSSSLKANMPWSGPVPRFYELPVYAHRVLFIIDQSGSMNQFEGEETRMYRAQRELVQVIGSLKNDTLFDILAFNDFVTPFSPRLVPASDEFKQNAILFSRNLIATKSTNCYDALTLALDADPNLEAIYFLSDGEPTTGGLIDPTEIVEAISRQNELRLTSIYTLGIGAYGTHEIFLKKLAEKNYGEYFPIQ